MNEASALRLFKVELTAALVEAVASGMVPTGPHAATGVSLAIKARESLIRLALDSSVHDWRRVVHAVAQVGTLTRACYFDAIDPVDRYVVVAETEPQTERLVIGQFLGQILEPQQATGASEGGLALGGDHYRK